MSREATMYRDLNGYRIERQPRRPRKPQISLTESQQKILLAALAAEAFLLFIAPICGASIIDAVVSIARAF